MKFRGKIISSNWNKQAKSKLGDQIDEIWKREEGYFKCVHMRTIHGSGGVKKLVIRCLHTKWVPHYVWGDLLASRGIRRYQSASVI